MIIINSDLKKKRKVWFTPLLSVVYLILSEDTPLVPS